MDQKFLHGVFQQVNFWAFESMWLHSIDSSDLWVKFHNGSIFSTFRACLTTDSPQKLWLYIVDKSLLIIFYKPWKQCHINALSKVTIHSFRQAFERKNFEHVWQH